MAFNPDLSPMGLPARYMLTRNGVNDFTVTLNIAMDAEGSDRDIRRTKVAKMKDKVESCFNEFTSTFKDGAGRRITFDVRIYDPKIVTDNWYSQINVR